jgi:drug/metabolite transporter (DMT)-like permease
MLLFRGLGKGSMAVVAPVTATGAATIPVLVGLATGESVAAPGLAGIALALVAIVLVSLSADEGVTAVDAHPGDPDAATGDVGSDDAPLVIPDGWAEQFGPALVPRPALAAAVDQHSVTVRADVLPPVPVATPAMPAPAPGTLVAPAVFPTADVKVRGPLVVMMVLLVALVLAAIGIAASPLADLASGAPLDVRRGAMLGFSLLAMGTTTVAIGVTHRLFALTSPANVAPRAPRHPDRRPDVRRPVIRRVLAQPGLPEALLSGIGFGTFFVFIYRASESAGHWPLVSARMVSVVMFAVGALVARAAVLPQRESRVGVMWAGVFDAAAAVLFVLAIRAGLLSVGAVLASLYPAVTVLLARAVTKERIRPQQVAGLGLALAAVSLLAI